MQRQWQPLRSGEQPAQAKVSGSLPIAPMKNITPPIQRPAETASADAEFRLWLQYASLEGNKLVNWLAARERRLERLAPPRQPQRRQAGRIPAPVRFVAKTANHLP